MLTKKCVYLYAVGCFPCTAVFVFAMQAVTPIMARMQARITRIRIIQRRMRIRIPPFLSNGSKILLEKALSLGKKFHHVKTDVGNFSLEVENFPIYHCRHSRHFRHLNLEKK